MEMWFINRTMVDRPPTAAAWASAQSGLNELLFSPAVKWRAGVELKRQAADTDEVGADAQIARYKSVLRSV